MKISFRILTTRFVKEKDFEQLLAFLNKHRDVVGELSLFTEYWHHGYYPLDQFQAFADVLGDRMRRLRAAGYGSIGINMLDTIGHVNEAWDWLTPLPYPTTVGHDGSSSQSCFCPNTDEFRDYIAKKYTMIVALDPAFIWVDDDLRMHHVGVGYACFCPTCMQIYNDRHGSSFTREQLVDRLNAKDGHAERAHWVEQNVTTLERVLAHIEHVVHSLNPGIELGLMTVPPLWGAYSGCGYERWLLALKATRVRPGGGFSDDQKPLELLPKLHEVSRQLSFMSAEVSDRQYELENFPYQHLAKSTRMFLTESTASVAVGMNGIAFNALKQEEGTLEEHHRIMNAIASAKPLWETMVERASDYRLTGLFAAFSPAFPSRQSVDNGDWFRNYAMEDGYKSYALSGIGLPLTSDPARATGTVLAGRMAEGYSDEELAGMLSQAVLMDGETLEIMQARGLGHLCGVAVDRVWNNGVMEQFTDDPFNGKYGGEQRDARSSFWGGQSYTLNPLASGITTISDLISYTGQNLGRAFTLYENEAGGRVAVQGYSPWNHILTGVKRKQLLDVADWLTRDGMPVRIELTHRVMPIVKASPDGKHMFVMLINASLDEMPSFGMEVRHDHESWSELMLDGSLTAIGNESLSVADGRARLQLGPIKPWDFRIVMTT